ncbi:helix-turn-helix domain-containing protein [Bifidobacterium bifidum]|uniref:helix-turn-helix domain-containing protein n=1 Tax=Bifidobacterium bifidum TaxID=1681 RepID=UPI0039E4E147
MGEVYSHLSEEERRAIQIEIGDGTSVRKMARLLGRSPSGISREIKRNTWVPVRRERVLPAVPAETAEDGPVDGRMLHRRPRAAQGRPQARQTAQALPPVMRTPVGAGGRMAGSRLVAAARRRQAARPVPRRPRHARVPGDRLPLGLRRPPSP